MNTPDETMINLVGKYIRHEMNEEESLQFEKDLQESDDLRETYNFVLSLNSASRQSTYKEMKSQFQLLETSRKTGEIHSDRSRWTSFLKYAALGLVLVSAIYVFQDRSQSNEELFAAYNTQYPSDHIPIIRSEVSEETSNLTKGFLAYESKEYAKALKFFESEERDSSIDFYRGICHLQLGDIDLAINLLRQLAVNTSSEHIEGARWFLALSLLKKGEKQQAKQTLKTLIDSGQTYQRQNAQNLLNALD